MTTQDRAKLFLLIERQVRDRVGVRQRLLKGEMSRKSYDESVNRFNRKLDDFLTAAIGKPTP